MRLIFLLPLLAAFVGVQKPRGDFDPHSAPSLCRRVDEDRGHSRDRELAPVERRPGNDVGCLRKKAGGAEVESALDRAMFLRGREDDDSGRLETGTSVPGQKHSLFHTSD